MALNTKSYDMCIEDGCTRLGVANGLCRKHYQKAWEEQRKQRALLANAKVPRANPYLRWVGLTQTTQEGKTELNQYIGIAKDILSDCSES